MCKMTGWQLNTGFAHSLNARLAPMQKNSVNKDPTRACVTALQTCGAWGWQAQVWASTQEDK